MKKYYFITVVLFLFLVAPYIFQDFNIQIANNYVNSLNYPEPIDTTYYEVNDSIYADFYDPWDTVFVNFIDNSGIELESLTIDKRNQYTVAIWHGTEDRSRNTKNATIIIDTWQFGPYAEADIEVFAWEGSRDYRERYICLLFFWIRIDQELTGMA